MTTAPAPRPFPSSSRRGALLLSTWCIVAAFGTYFCTYAYRKPFTAAAYSADYKALLVAAQMVGYMLSKFIGIKVVAEMRPERRALAILVLVGLAQVALLLFAIIPPPYNLICMFLNGLPLGMVFGLILGFLEGRKATEALTAGLCVSFIIASGVTKSVGGKLLTWGIELFWMPFVSGLVFAGPLLFFVWMLSRIPPPTEDDVASRQARLPMNASERWRFFFTYALGLIPLLGFFLLCTVLRNLRDDFARELWQGLGYGEKGPELFTYSEAPVAFVVVVVNGASILIRNNRQALLGALGTSLIGFLLGLIALVGLESGRLSGFAFVVLLGVGLYLPYIAVHTTILERLIALSRDRGNLGYLMSLADSLGYLGYVILLLSVPSEPALFIQYFKLASWIVCLASLVFLAATMVFFIRRMPSENPKRMGASASSGGPGNLPQSLESVPVPGRGFVGQRL
jgi:hypothetical protein